jgi:hypothetical protein
MNAAKLPEELCAECHCPSCGDDLSPGKCVDPWSICLSCARGHRFFIMPQPPLAADSVMDGANLPSMGDHSPEAIANYWLSDPLLRSLLNQQLAELLRIFLESRRVTDEPEFSFCPICGGTLVEYDQPDIWVRGLRCHRSHSWALRGYRIYSWPLELLAEPSDAVVSQLIAGWLKDNSHLKPYLHESIRRVLTCSPLCPKDATESGA